MPSAEALMEVGVESIAAGGDGVARHAGMVVFVPRSAPGDRVRVSVKAGKRFARGRLAEVLAPGPGRVEPPCPHYTLDDCGGCQVQHLSYDAQLAAKRTIIGDSMRRIARRDVPDPVVEASDRPWRYRRKLSLTIRRTKDGVVAGLRRYHDPDSIFALDDCLITDEAVVAAWREVLSAPDLLPASAELRGAVRVVEGDATLVVAGGERWPHAERLLESAPSLRAIWWIPAGKSRRLVAERAPSPAGASFAQVNAAVAASMKAHLVERALAHHPTTAVDAYSGVGDTAVRLAREGVSVTAIELDREAAAVACELLPAGSRSVAGAVERLLGDHLPADVVIVNPPRVGLDQRVTAALAGSSATRAIIYASCDPATLARDVGRLDGWRIASLRGFDMFPQTAHVETVCELVPEVE
jgi:23S rRNA (uracil1939-C5)-methyltransferase